MDFLLVIAILIGCSGLFLIAKPVTGANILSIFFRFSNKLSLRSIPKEEAKIRPGLVLFLGILMVALSLQSLLY
ncbi:hypothetical protein [Thalassotalea crassostreae]|uniref:hypothetical protein n=1 Tax=Thalassotalea crassostreae TaxID=1763536 RepID=UPI000838A6F0|nr:hypothetical protein [Thalassotalea crassostreae]